MNRASIDIKTTVRSGVPRVPFEDILHAALPHYSLSLVLCGDELARRMNREYRQKTYYPNVLSFPLTKEEGEIFLNIRKAEREARSLGVSARSRIAFLFIHGLLHLGGLDHGATMERAEMRLMKRFGF